MKSDIIGLVMNMYAFQKLVITDVSCPFAVHHFKNDSYHMRNRRNYGLCICIRGQITMVMDGHSYVSDPEHAILLPKFASYYANPDKESDFYVINFQCQGAELDTIHVLPVADQQTCLRDCQRMRTLYLFERKLGVLALFYDLLDRFFRYPAAEKTPLAKALDYMKNNLSDPALSNQTIAREVGISEVYLRKLFSSQFNTTPRQYLLDLRLQKAKQFLMDTPFSVSAISAECGFSSLYHFSRIFKEKVGMNPTRYANTHRHEQI